MCIQVTDLIFMLFTSIVLENCVIISFKFLLYCRVIIGLRKVIKNRNSRLFTLFVKKKNKFFKKRMKRLCVYLFPIQDFFTGFLWKLITSCLRREAQTNQTTGIYIFVTYRELSHMGKRIFIWIFVSGWRHGFGSIIDWTWAKWVSSLNRWSWLLGLGSMYQRDWVGLSA